MKILVHIPVARTLVTLAWAGVFALLLPGMASAHGDILGSTPADNEKLEAAPSTVEFRFSSAIEPKFAAVAVTSGEGHRLDQGQPAVVGGAVRIAVRAPAPFGEYTAAYRVVSSDGHPIEGSIRYTVMPTSSVIHPGTVSGTAPAQPTPIRPGPSPIWGWLTGAVALIATSAVAVRRRGGRSDR